MLSLRLWSFAFILSLCVGCGGNKNQFEISSATNSQSSIIGGTPATAEDLVTKSTVSLVIDYQGQAFSMCTGTLISQDMVLTASHCLEHLGEGYLFAYIGAKLPKDFNKAQLLEVKAWKTHPDYKLVSDSQGNIISGINDVALIRLRSPVVAPAEPVAILDENNSLQAGQTLLLAGFGLLHEMDRPIYADGLYSVNVRLHGLQGHILITDQTQARGGCNGDSGGPAYLKNATKMTVVGITGGPHNGARDCRHYGEYTNASMFKSFILQTTQQLGGEIPNFVTLPWAL